MKAARLFGLTLAPLLCLTQPGCHSQKTESTQEDQDEKLSLFQKGKGVCLPEDLRKEFGVEVVEVEEKALPRHLAKTARVYRAARDGQEAGASMLVTAGEAKALKQGQPVTLRHPSGQGPGLTGTLARMDKQAQPVLGQEEMLIEFPDAGRCFPAGVVLTAGFTTGEAKRVFAVPESALLMAADGCFVYVVNGNYFTRTKVKTGVASDGSVEIEDGLYAGDLIAIQGMENLWLIELSALKGGTPCCPVPKKAASPKK